MSLIGFSVDDRDHASTMLAEVESVGDGNAVRSFSMLLVQEYFF